jgi:hypothetical protein
LQNSRVVPVGGWHVVDEDAFWTVDASLEAVVGDFTTGLPSGSIHGAAAVPRRVSLTASLELPAVANVLPIRRLVMTARRLADGKTGVRVDAQVAWIKPVLIVPKGTLLSIRITAPAGEGRPRSLTITSPREVRGVVALLNGLDRAARTGTGTGTGTGPSLGPCFGGYGIQVRLSFIGHTGDQPLARATLDAGCLGIMVKLTIDGHTEPTLNGYALEGSNDSQEALLLAQGLETELHLNLPPVLLTPWALDVPVNPSVQPAQLSGGR